MFVHVIIVSIFLNLKDKVVMVLKNDLFPMVFKIANSLHPIMLIKAQW